jgi:hypothetical protein
MKLRTFYLMTVSSGADGRSRKVTVGKPLTLAVMAVCALAFAGFLRFAFIVGYFGISRFDAYSEKQKNRLLIDQIDFCSKLRTHQERKLGSMVGLDDEMRMRFGLNQISADVRKAGVGGLPPRTLPDRVRDDPMLQKAETVRSGIENLIRQSELECTLFSLTVNHVKRKYDFWAQFPSIKPTEGRITSGFGFRTDPISGIQAFHEGLDIANAPWTPVFVSADGVVEAVERKLHFGNVVIVRHYESGYKTVYAHLERADVVEGQVLKRGDMIGYLGSSGRSTGPHLHYEVHRLGQPQNPLHYIFNDSVVFD